MMPRLGQPHTPKARAALRAAHSTPEARQRARDSAAVYWTPERRAEAKEAAVVRAADPAWRAKVRVKTRQAMADPAVKARHRAALDDPNVRDRIAEGVRKALTDPAVHARIAANMDRARLHPKRQALSAEGIRRRFEADQVLVELEALRVAWIASGPKARRAFVDQLFGPLWAKEIDGAS